MTTIPSLRFSITTWLNFHHHHCSSLITNCLKSIIIRDSIAAGLNRYWCVSTKYQEPLKTLNCGIGGNSVQNVLWQAQNLPVISNVKYVIIFWEKNNLFQDSPEDNADGITEIAWKFHSKYNSINMAIGGILPCDASWSIYWVLTKETNKFYNQNVQSHSLYIYQIWYSLDCCKWFT